jgi:EAL domain-containing protein (putative c-di-GMP-specific phosphodiesterase class I)
MTGEFLGVEALIRWNHPTLGKISPAEFIPIAEEIGLIGRIGEWVLETACTQCKEWQATGYPAIRVAVNVSTLQFQHDLIGMIKRVLFTTGLAPEALELEITESVMHNKATISKLTEIKQMGISISVDDFGTGYSSLSYLKRLPIDALKIDRSFICDIDADETDTDIVRAIISLAKSLNLKIVAEGVETDEQLQFVKLYQCDEAQGYLINEPVPAEQFEMMLKRVHLVSARIVEKTGIPAAAGFNRRL